MQEVEPSQYSPFRKELYKLELECLEHYMHDREKVYQIREKMHQLAIGNFPDYPAWLEKAFYSVFKIYYSIHLSHETLTRLVNMNTHGLSDISDSSFSEAIRYVEGIANIDLSNVQEARLESHVSEYIEGECVPCGDRDHRIYYSFESNQVSSVDLLCHEIGHAADFTIARLGSSEDAMLTRYLSLAETAAYYCQYRYLQDHGSVKARTASLGAFVYTYLAFLFCHHCLETKVSLDKAVPEEAVEHKIFEDFVTAYTSAYGIRGAKNFLVMKMTEIQGRFPSIGDVVNQELVPRLGIPLSLALLGIKDFELSHVSSRNSLSVDLKQLLDDIDPGIIEKIHDMDTLIANYTA